MGVKREETKTKVKRMDASEIAELMVEPDLADLKRWEGWMRRTEHFAPELARVRFLALVKLARKGIGAKPLVRALEKVLETGEEAEVANEGVVGERQWDEVERGAVMALHSFRMTAEIEERVAAWEEEVDSPTI